MEWAKPIMDFIGKFRTFFAWLLGYFKGKKVQKLADELHYQKAKVEYEKARAKKLESILTKWRRIRDDKSRSLSHLNSSELREEGAESAIPLNDSGAELRPDRE